MLAAFIFDNMEAVVSSSMISYITHVCASLSFYFEMLVHCNFPVGAYSSHFFPFLPLSIVYLLEGLWSKENFKFSADDDGGYGDLRKDFKTV